MNVLSKFVPVSVCVCVICWGVGFLCRLNTVYVFCYQNEVQELFLGVSKIVLRLSPMSDRWGGVGGPVYKIKIYFQRLLIWYEI